MSDKASRDLRIGTFAAIGAYAYSSGNDGRILPGISIGGVSVAGSTPAQAKAKLLQALPDVSSGTLAVKAGSVEQNIAYADIGRAYDLDSSISAQPR